MRKISIRYFLALFFCAGLFAMQGCMMTSHPAHFYVLSPMLRNDNANAAAKSMQGAAFEIGPVEIPEYLNRPQIVTFHNSNVAHLAEFEHWAEPLKHNISRVIAENMSVLLNTDKVFIFPQKKRTPVEYQIEVNILRFDGELGKDLFLSALWSVVDVEKEEQLFIGRSNFKEKINGADYIAFTSAQSKALEKLCVKIAEKVKESTSKK